MTPPETKTCPCCSTVQAVTEFYRDVRTLTGLTSWCKTCQRERRNERYAADIEGSRAKSLAGYYAAKARR